MSKLMMLVAAKWREFSTINPHLQVEQSETNEPEYNLKPSRTRPAKENKVMKWFYLNLRNFNFIKLSRRQMLLMMMRRKMMTMILKTKRDVVRGLKNRRRRHLKYQR